MTPDLTHPDLEKKDAELRALAKGGDMEITAELPKLGPIESKVFSAWQDADTDWAYPFASISQLSGVHICQIRRAVRSLARKGLVVFRRGLFTDEGYTAGSGYSLTEAGYAAHRAIAEAEGER